MRVKYGVIAAMTLALLMSVVVAPPSRADVSFDVFYSSLSPHGSWLVSAQYGRVWQPRVYARDWNPYYDGHWDYADVGWTWVSDYSWGAIPYHYGTWYFDPVLGWVWVPGTTWAPAWVVFRTGPDYIGWAPVAPGFSVGLSFGTSAPVSGSFLFVSTRDFCAPKIRSYVVPDRDALTIVHKTTIVNNLVVQNNIVVNRGPDVRAVEAAAGREIRVSQVESLPRVAPFQNVRREQLAIAPERDRRSVRAAEPVSAKHPLPPSKERAALSREPAQDRPRFGRPDRDSAEPRRETEKGSPRETPRAKETVAPSRETRQDAPHAMPPDKPRVTPQPKSTPDKTVRTEKRTTPAKPEKKAVSKPKPAEPKKKQDGQNDPS